jgi:hypothetical protein
MRAGGLETNRPRIGLPGEVALFLPHAVYRQMRG